MIFSYDTPSLCKRSCSEKFNKLLHPLNRQFYLHKPINPINHWKRKDVPCYFSKLYNFIAINPNWLAHHSNNCTSFVFHICITWRILICTSLFTMSLYCSSPYIEPPVIYANTINQFTYLCNTGALRTAIFASYPHLLL